MYADHLLVSARMETRQQEADRRRLVAQVRRVGRQPAPNTVRVAVGQLLVRTGERLSGTSPGARHA